MEHRFSINLRQQILLLTPLFLKNGILFLIYFYLFGLSTPTTVLICVIGFVTVFDIIPTIIIHFQYLFHDWKSLLIINSLNNSFEYKSSSKQIQCLLSDILYLEHYASYGGGTGFYSFAEYRYTKIVLKDNVEIIVTCTMINNIKNVLPILLNLNPEKRLRVIAFIY